MAAAMAQEAIDSTRITSLLIRYWGFGKRLDEQERDVLLEALDKENKELHAPIHMRAIKRLKDMGVE